MAEDDLSKLVGDFYRGAGISNGFYEVRRGEISEELWPTYWYRADFVDPETTISSEITEWRDESATNNYLGTISIRHSGLFVYNAVVSRHDSSDHANLQFSMDTAWKLALEEIIARYQG